MTKHYFKYASGYINVDDDNLYLTNSGNWQEAHGLEEKNRTTQSRNDSRTSRMKGFVIVVFVGVGVFIFMQLNNKNIALPWLAGLGLLAWRVLSYFKSEFGNRYKIPLSKIISVEAQGSNGLKISFYNALGTADYEEIKNVEAKGMAFLTDISKNTIA